MVGRRKQRGISRRSLIAGGFITAGGTLLVADSDAFSQTIATRGTTIDVGTDDNALLDIDVVQLVTTGSESELVTTTNNTDGELSISVALTDSADGSVSEPSTRSVPSGSSDTFSAFISSDVDTGNGELPFEIAATDGDSFQVEATRRTSIPSLSYAIIDETQDSNVSFTVQYKVKHVPNFEQIQISIENTNPNRNLSDSYQKNSPEGVISYPRNGGTDSGAAGHTYEFRFEVTDTNIGTVIDRTVMKEANGADSSDGNLRDKTDPQLDSFTVTDQSSWEDGTNLNVDYLIENTDNFDRVNVTFDTQGNWADETIPSTDPDGSVTHSNEGTNGTTYEITVEVETESGLVVDSGSVTTQSGSNQTISWP